MSLQRSLMQPIPEATVRVARAAFPKGNPYLLLHDELGALFTNEDFVKLYSARGQPALPPWHLALALILQFRENLSDRQAAEMVRDRIDWKLRLHEKRGKRHVVPAHHQVIAYLDAYIAAAGLQGRRKSRSFVGSRVAAN